MPVGWPPLSEMREKVVAKEFVGYGVSRCVEYTADPIPFLPAPDLLNEMTRWSMAKLEGKRGKSRSDGPFWGYH